MTVLLSLKVRNQRISDEEVAEDMPKISEKNFGIRLLAEALNTVDVALELFERQDPKTSQYA
jgi:hypothetical protein